MAGSLKLMLALIFLGASCKSFAFRTDGEAAENQYETFLEEPAANDRKIEEEMAKQTESNFARENEAEANRQIQSEFARYVQTEIAAREEAKLEKRSQCQHDIVRVATAADNIFYRFPVDSNQRVLGDDFIIFAVRACNNAFVRLSTYWLQSNDIRILIGADLNRHSRIKFNGTETYTSGRGTYAVHSPLGCNNIRFFWARWIHSGHDTTTIIVGKGAAVGEDAFMSYTGKFYIEIKYVSVATAKGTSGLWTFFDHSAL